MLTPTKQKAFSQLLNRGDLVALKMLFLFIDSGKHTGVNMIIEFKKLPMQHELKNIFDYKDGHLIWRIGNKAGDTVGKFSSKSKSGYILISLNSKEISNLISVRGIFFSHRLIYTWHNGEIPKGYVIDHRNHMRNDNRIENLQLLTHSDNSKKKMKGNCRDRYKQEIYQEMYYDIYDGDKHGYNTKILEFINNIKNERKTIFINKKVDIDLRAKEYLQNKKNQMLNYP